MAHEGREMNFNISDKIILLTLAGSHAYGTNLPESDVDVRGICIAPFDIRVSSFHRFDQYEGKWPENLLPKVNKFNYKRVNEVIPLKNPHDPDSGYVYPEDLVIYDIAKAIKLIGNCNPNMMELLFSEYEDYLIITMMGAWLIDERKKFLSLKVKHTYTGYAMAQLKKIERHRKYLLGDIPKKPTRTEHGLPEHESLIPQAERNLINEEIQNRLREWTADNIELEAAERLTLNENMRSFMCAVLKVQDNELDEKLEDTAAESLGFDQNVREILRRERAFRNALKEFKSYQRWEKERNPKRKELEAKHGFDTKHAMHLVRLARSGIEILRDGNLNVRRDDWEELLSIRRGEKAFEEIKEEAEFLMKGMDHYYENNPQNLPHKVDTEYLDRLTRGIILMSIR